MERTLSDEILRQVLVVKRGIWISLLSNTWNVNKFQLKRDKKTRKTENIKHFSIK